MTSALPPSVSAVPAALPAASTAPASAASAVFSVSPASGVATVAQVAPILAAAQAALAQPVNLSSQAQQAIKAEAFAQLVSQLAQQIQGSSVQSPANWPTAGVAPQWQALLTALVQQASAGQTLPQQMVTAQAWPSALAQAVLQGGAGAAAPPATAVPTPAPVLQSAVPSAPGLPLVPPAVAASVAVPAMPVGAASPTLPLPVVVPAAASAGAGAGSETLLATALPAAAADEVATDTVRPALPGLQNWVVQQGVLQGADGNRAFTLTLKVPVAWAQAQSVLGQALGASSSRAGTGAGASGPLVLPFAGNVQQLANTAFGLVMAPQGLSTAQAQAMRTSAVLQMDFQPVPATVGSAAQQAAAVALLPPGVLPQDAYQALLARSGDPWLHMAQQQASTPLPRERQGHQEGYCEARDCQYQGRAECAQPFCAEMNSLWATDRASRAGRR